MKFYIFDSVCCVLLSEVAAIICGPRCSILTICRDFVFHMFAVHLLHTFHVIGYDFGERRRLL